MVFRKGSCGGGGESLGSLGTNLSNTLENEVGHFDLMQFSFVKMLFFAYLLLLTRS